MSPTSQTLFCTILPSAWKLASGRFLLTSDVLLILLIKPLSILSSFEHTAGIFTVQILVSHWRVQTSICVRSQSWTRTTWCLVLVCVFEVVV
nr:hypothetical protein BgiMline_021840 [Biomphalaria glabrata]